jgi:hypothetical protein
MRRRCERVDGRAAEYFVTSGRELLGTVKMVTGGKYHAVASDGTDCGEHALLSDATRSLPERNERTEEAKEQ